MNHSVRCEFGSLGVPGASVVVAATSGAARRAVPSPGTVHARDQAAHAAAGRRAAQPEPPGPGQKSPGRPEAAQLTQSGERRQGGQRLRLGQQLRQSADVAEGGGRVGPSRPSGAAHVMVPVPTAVPGSVIPVVPIVSVRRLD